MDRRWERGNNPFGGLLLGLLVTQRPAGVLVKILSVRAAIYRKKCLPICRHAVDREFGDRASTIVIERQAANWWAAGNSQRIFRFRAIAGDLARKLPVVIGTGCRWDVTPGRSRRNVPLVVWCSWLILQ